MTWLMLSFSELMPLPVSLSLSSTVPTDTKCSSEFSGKLQVIHCLQKHCLGETLTPSYATVKTQRLNPALWGSFQLPHHPSLVYKPAITSPHPALHQRRGCWQQITPAHSVCETRVLPRGNPCVRESITMHVPAGWGLIYGCVGQPLFCFFPSLLHIGLGNTNVLFVHEWVRERPGTAEQMVMLSPGETRAIPAQGELGDLALSEAMFFYCILFMCWWNEP